MGIRDRLAQLLREAPAGTDAVEFDDEWWTWGHLQATAADLDSELTSAGLGRDSRVGVILENRPEHVAVVATLVATGRCLVTLSPLQPPERLLADIVRSDAPIVVTSPEVLSRVGGMAGFGDRLVLAIAPDGAVSKLGGAAPTGADTSPGVAIEMLTSGTTGPPKRVRLTEFQLDVSMGSSGQQPREGELLSRAVTLVATPMVHIGGLWGALSALYVGRRIALLPRFTLEPWVRAVEKHRPRAAGLVPAAMRTVLDAGVPADKLASLQVVTSGTAPCPPELADRMLDTYGIRVLMTYGATEFAGAVAGWTLPLHERWWPTKKGSAGRPFPGVTMRVTDPQGNELPVGQNGHLEICTAQSALGADAWVGTSDLASLDEDGFVWITGRADDAIIRGGFKVHPDVVKKALETHPDVREAAVAGFPDERLGEVPVAVVERRVGADPSIEDLTAICRQQLTPYEVPAHVLVVDELPRTPSSKVSRLDLLDLVRDAIARKVA